MALRWIRLDAARDVVRSLFHIAAPPPGLQSLLVRIPYIPDALETADYDALIGWPALRYVTLYTVDEALTAPLAAEMHRRGGWLVEGDPP